MIEQIGAVVEASAAWAAQADVPNGLFVLALLTRPATWTGVALQAVRSRLGGNPGQQAAAAADEAESDRA